MNAPYSKERMMKQGLLGEKEKHLRDLKYRAQGILGSISDATFLVDTHDPFVLETPRIMNYAKELHEVVEQGQQLKAQIDQLKADLGV